MKTCPECKGTSFDYLSPRDLEEFYNVSTNDTIAICNNCHYDITESLQIQDIIVEIETYLNLNGYPVFNNKYIEPQYFLQ